LAASPDTNDTQKRASQRGFSDAVGSVAADKMDTSTRAREDLGRDRMTTRQVLGAGILPGRGRARCSPMSCNRGGPPMEPADRSRIPPEDQIALVHEALIDLLRGVPYDVALNGLARATLQILYAIPTAQAMREGRELPPDELRGAALPICEGFITALRMLVAADPHAAVVPLTFSRN
jgi:hypothetical protein